MSYCVIEIKIVESREGSLLEFRLGRHAKGIEVDPMGDIREVRPGTTIKFELTESWLRQGFRFGGICFSARDGETVGGKVAYGRVYADGVGCVDQHGRSTCFDVCSEADSEGFTALLVTDKGTQGRSWHYRLSIIDSPLRSIDPRIENKGDWVGDGTETGEEPPAARPPGTRAHRRRGWRRFFPRR